MSQPPLTLGMPVYNGADYVAAAVTSMLEQTYGDFRFLISDNGSTDDTVEVLRGLAAQDPRIELLLSPTNRGAAWNYNTLAADVPTPYFKWLAHDDLHDPTYLEACMAVALAEPDVVAVHCRARYVDSDGREIQRSFRQAAFGDRSPSSRLHQILNSTHDHTFAFSLMRTSTLRSIRPFEPGFAADRIMLAEFGLAGRMIELPQHLFANRLHPHRSVALNSGRAGKLSYQSWWGGPGLSPDRAATWAAVGRLRSAVTRSAVTGPEERRCHAEVARWARKRWRGLAVESPHVARAVLDRRPTAVAAGTP